MGELGRARDYFAKAFELREHASEREKLDITADYYENVTGELERRRKPIRRGLRATRAIPVAFSIWAMCMPSKDSMKRQRIFANASALPRTMSPYTEIL